MGRRGVFAADRREPRASQLSLRLQSHSRVRFFGGLGGGSDLHRDFHSTPDLNVQAQSSSLIAPKCHRSQEDVNALNGRNGLPPPNHPPPPPPVGQVVKVNVGANVPDVVTPASVYDNMAHIQQVKGRQTGLALISRRVFPVSSYPWYPSSVFVVLLALVIAMMNKC